MNSTQNFILLKVFLYSSLYFSLWLLILWLHRPEYVPVQAKIRACRFQVVQGKTPQQALLKHLKSSLPFWRAFKPVQFFSFIKTFEWLVNWYDLYITSIVPKCRRHWVDSLLNCTASLSCSYNPKKKKYGFKSHSTLRLCKITTFPICLLMFVTERF